MPAGPAKAAPGEAEPRFVLVGVVGYTPVVEAYPLGPRLMASLEAAAAKQDGLRIENMTWGPIHIVQRFQDEGAARPDRLILVGASAVCRAPGRVQAFRWRGGNLPEAALQERIYEGVTGIVDIENTLAIGAHFGVWPPETFTVEIDLPADTFGAMVLAESAARAGDAATAADPGFAPGEAIETLRRFVLDLVEKGNSASCRPVDKEAGGLAPVARFIRNEFVGDRAGPVA